MVISFGFLTLNLIRRPLLLDLLAINLMTVFCKRADISKRVQVMHFNICSIRRCRSLFILVRVFLAKLKNQIVEHTWAPDFPRLSHRV